MAQFSQARSEEVGDLGMKRSKALVLLAMFVLGFCILSEAQSDRHNGQDYPRCTDLCR
jgi:hypothetical protein